MNRKHFRRVAAFAILAVIALGSVACVTTVGVGVGVPVYGGYGGYGPHPYGGGYGGRPMWP
jgi:hypothetical protein